MTGTTDHITGAARAAARRETQRERRGHVFYPRPGELPALYGTEDQDLAEKVIGAHYFAAGCDWWIVEYDPATAQGFGYACLGDWACAEWGYVDLAELEQLATGHLIVERDLHWRPTRVDAAELPGHAT